MSFFAPAFLAALLALAIPVGIHMIARQNAPLRPFPSLRFIRSSRLPRQGRNKPRDLLLLLLRLLIFALAVLALSKPFRPESGTWSLQKPAGVLVVDSSASMHFKGVATEAKKQMKAATKAYGQLALVAFDYETRFLSDFTSDKNRVIEQATRLVEKPRIFEGAPSAALDKIREYFKDKKEDYKLLIVSDFQRTNWAKSRLSSMEKDVRLINVASKKPFNIQLVFARSYMHEGKPRVYAQIRNMSEEEQVVPVLLDGKALGQAKVGGGINQGFYFDTNVGNYSQAGVLSLDIEDDYPLDNNYHLWVGEAVPVQVRFLAREGLEPSSSAFLKAALNLKSRTPGYRFYAKASTLKAPPPADIFYLEGKFLSKLSADEITLLKQFTRTGGHLLITAPNNEQDLAVLNRLGLPTIPWKGFRITQVGMEAPSYIDSVAEPLEQKLETETLEDLYLTEIYHYAILGVPKEANVWLANERKEPLLMTIPAGQGSYFLLAFDLDPKSTDLPLRSAFLPFIHTVLTTTQEGLSRAVYLKPSDTLPNDGHRQASSEVNQQAGEPRAFQMGKKIVSVNVSRLESFTELSNLEKIEKSLQPTRRVKKQEARMEELKQQSAYKLALPIAGLCFLFLLLESCFTLLMDRRNQ